jgi:hypothetical protein
MSICSDVYISKEKAQLMVKNKLLYQQELLINLAVKAMEDFELSGYLNEDGSIYYYNIESDEEEEEDDR